MIIELRVWQNVTHEESLWVSARPKGGDWDTLGTVPLAWNGQLNGYGAMSKHRFGDIELADVKLRVWQREREPGRIYVEACGACPARQSVRWQAWRPLGMIPLPLDDGLSRGGYYRYGDMDIAIPHRSPLLLEDREYLLALRDVLAGTATLNWDVGTPTTNWGGVIVTGTPPRVRGLNLAYRGLTGEIWGWLGNLTALTELRLNGNALTGSIPSKLHLLRRLTHVYLDGNHFHGCVPPRLWEAAHHDLDRLGLPRCEAPAGLPARTTRRRTREAVQGRIQPQPGAWTSTPSTRRQGDGFAPRRGLRSIYASVRPPEHLRRGRVGHRSADRRPVRHVALPGLVDSRELEAQPLFGVHLRVRRMAVAGFHARATGRLHLGEPGCHRIQ